MVGPEHVLSYIKTIPLQPGVYRFFDKDETIIYVGKAKKLRNRVSSYFQESANHSNKTRRMVAQIQRIEYTVVNTEFDSLLLENSLIKANQPRYNILLRDDKTYPYVVVRNERFPRIESTRNVDKKKGKYFGPYSSVVALKSVLEVIRKTYNIRTCSYHLSDENIKAGKFKVCLEYHLGNCLGPCEGLQSQEDYDRDIDQSKSVLKGDFNLAKSYFKDEMQKLSEDLQFEKAQETKEKLDKLENYQERSVVANPKFLDLDVFTILRNENTAFVNYLKVQRGMITASNNAKVKVNLDETDSEVLAQSIIRLREDISSSAQELVSNIELPSLEEHFTIVVPKIGDKKKLIDLSLKNLFQYKKEHTHKIEKAQTPADRILATLQQDLRMRYAPKHIECFDNSNIQGTNPVASMVCFRNGKPAKKDYRHFKIKTVDGPDDFASMREIVHRRYKRLLDENKELPQLVVIDGGKGQLSAALESLTALGIRDKLTVVGIAKRLEEIYYPGDNHPLYISKKSESLKVLQHLRNEAHRFAITFHRDRRSKTFIENEMDNIEGVGPKTTTALLKAFRSNKAVKSATLEELSAIIGTAKAKLVHKHFHTGA